MKDEYCFIILCGMIDHCAQEKEMHVAQKTLNQVHQKKRTNREFRLNAQIRDYDMDNIIMDLEFDVNHTDTDLGHDGLTEVDLVPYPVEIRKPA
jgi:hypothetical protein